MEVRERESMKQRLPGEAEKNQAFQRKGRKGQTTFQCPWDTSTLLVLRICDCPMYTINPFYLN